MKVLVIGLGSMGKRRIRLLKRISPDISIMGVDTNVTRSEFAQKEYGIEVCNDLEDALSSYKAECAIVSTAPSSHAEIIEKCLKAGLHVFTELNLVDDMYNENMQLAAQKGLSLFLSSTFLYRDEISYIIETLKKQITPVNYSYHVGQYLPDWHPWETIQDFFVGHRRTNGCRELLAIELPWLCRAFGKVISYKVIKSKTTTLPIDYCDNYLILLEHENGNKGMLAVDVMSRKAVRNLEIFGEYIYIAWDGTPTGLTSFDIESREETKVLLYDKVDSLKGYSAFIVENAYQKELENFFDVVQGKNHAKYSFAEDKEILKLIDCIEES